MPKGPQGQTCTETLPGWQVSANELSNGHWRVECYHVDGRSVSRDGGDLEALRRQCIADAKTLPEKRKA